MYKGKRGPSSKVDLGELDLLIERGYSNKQLAEHFEVTESRISQKKNELQSWRKEQQITTAVTPSEKSILVLDQLIEINTGLMEVQRCLLETIGNRKFSKDDLPFIRSLVEVQKELRSQLQFDMERIEILYDTASAVLFSEKITQIVHEFSEKYPEFRELFANRIENIEITEIPALTG